MCLFIHAGRRGSRWLWMLFIFYTKIKHLSWTLRICLSVANVQRLYVSPTEKKKTFRGKILIAPLCACVLWGALDRWRSLARRRCTAVMRRLLVNALQDDSPSQTAACSSEWFSVPINSEVLPGLKVLSHLRSQGRKVISDWVHLQPLQLHWKGCSQRITFPVYTRSLSESWYSMPGRLFRKPRTRGSIQGDKNSSLRPNYLSVTPPVKYLFSSQKAEDLQDVSAVP